MRADYPARLRALRYYIAICKFYDEEVELRTARKLIEQVWRLFK